MTKDWLGIDSNMFGSPSKGKSNLKKFPTPKPRYTKQKSKPILTKKDQETAKKIIKETGSAFGSVFSKIKNRKIRKLEKETMKNINKAEAMAHELKTIQENKEALIDIARYRKELDKENDKQWMKPGN